MEGFSVEVALSSVVWVWGERSVVVVVEGEAGSWVLWMWLQYLERTAVRERIGWEWKRGAAAYSSALA